jgi:AhpD family alkylhydroperoxidase
MKPFPRRTYRSPKGLLTDLGYILRRRRLIRPAFRQQLSPAFRERLMLAVTAVNACRYCSYFHAGEALRSGVPADQLAELLAGEIPAGAPPEEQVALLYAQHWAEQDARPDPEPAQRLLDTYGPEKSDAIHLALRMIRIGNLLGNSGDAMLYYLSFGRLGAPNLTPSPFPVGKWGGG